MRSRGIRAGDIVQVVRDCCGHYLGRIYVVGVVEFIASAVHSNSINCNYCAWQESNLVIAWNERHGANPVACPVRWLKRFEPPAEPLAEIEKLYRADPQPQRFKVERLRELIGGDAHDRFVRWLREGPR